MPVDIPLLRSHLYAPGNNLRLLEKVFLVGADAVVLDLEDSVPPAEKARARDLVSQAVRSRASHPWPVVFVRVNHPESGLAEDDVRAVVQPGLVGLRLPKVDDAETVREVAAWVEQAEDRVGLPVGAITLICNIESAAGVFCVFEITVAHPRVLGLACGAVDLARDLGVTLSEAGLETLYARSRLVLVSRVAGVQPPVDAVYPQLDDPEGLKRATRQGRALRFFGKSAIHPSQVPIIHAIYTPTEAEVAHAREVVAAAEAAEARGSGALRLEEEFVDMAVVRRARDILRLAERPRQ